MMTVVENQCNQYEGLICPKQIVLYCYMHVADCEFHKIAYKVLTMFSLFRIIKSKLNNAKIILTNIQHCVSQVFANR